MKSMYLDCGAGMSGNMFWGGLLSLGLPEEYIIGELTKLPLVLPKITITSVSRSGLQGIHVDVADFREHHHRHLEDVVMIIRNSKFTSSITESAIKVFTNLAEAEAKVHGVSISEIHFHEVGAIDAIVDIVSACIGMEYFGLQSFNVSPIRVGFGTINCAHGQIPLPAPATVELLKDFSVYGGDLAGEWTTPTGAAIIKTFAKNCGSLPMMKVERIGYGAGTRESSFPNVVRLILGDIVTESKSNDSQVVLEANIDDMNPEIYGYLGELLLKAGAKDYFFTPVQMKKGRPGVLISVIAPLGKVTEIEELLFKETTTFGVRKYDVQRSCLERDEISVTVSGIIIKVKTAYRNGKLLKFAPEYEECVIAAKILDCPLKEVYERAIFETRKILQHEGAS